MFWKKSSASESLTEWMLDFKKVNGHFPIIEFHDQALSECPIFLNSEKGIYPKDPEIFGTQNKVFQIVSIPDYVSFHPQQIPMFIKHKKTPNK